MKERGGGANLSKREVQKDGHFYEGAMEVFGGGTDIFIFFRSLS